MQDLPGTMNDRDGWRERVREICVRGMMMMMRLQIIYIMHKEIDFILPTMLNMP